MTDKTQSTSETTTRFPLGVETFNEDALGLKTFCRKLENYLIIDNDFVEGSLVVSLNAEFGYGKSTFLKMWENDLNARLEQDNETPLVINLNAWESDYYDEPLLPIISALIEAIEKQIEAPDTNTNFQQLKDAAKDVAWFTLGIANSFIKEGLKVDVRDTGKFTQDKHDARKEAKETARPDLLDEYQKRRHALWNLRRQIKKYLQNGSTHIFIFIDELDRCRPDYAVSYLETIKHIFDINGLVFVLAIDYEHLENSAKSLYGQDLKFSKYFRKFVHRSFELPEPSDSNRDEFAKQLTDFYFDNKTNRFTSLDLNHSRDDIPELISALKMNPRESIEFFRMLGHTTSTPKKQDTNYSIGSGLGMMIMCALKVKQPDLYKLLGSGETPHSEIAKMLKQGIGHEKAYEWFLIYLGGFKDRGAAYEILKAAELLSDQATEGQVQKDISHYASLWRSKFLSDRYPKFYKMIESKELQ